MNRSLHNLLLFTSSISIAGCVNTVRPDLAPTTSPVPQSSQAVTLPTGIPTSTSAKISEDPTETPSIDQCFDVISAPPSNMAYSGVLVLESKSVDQNRRVKKETFLINLNAKTEIRIGSPQSRISEYAVSPDGRWLAYREHLLGESDTRQLVIINGRGQQIKILPWEEDWGYINEWLDNHHLVIGIKRKTSEDQSETLTSFLVLDPFSEERMILQPDFPGIFHTRPGNAFDGWVSTVYGPSLERVVYLQSDEVHGPFHYVLWDTNASQSLASFPVIVDLEATPRWSPDGEHFAFAPVLFLDDESPPKW